MQLSAPQNIFLNGLDSKYRAYVGGFGSGKTFVGCLDLLIFASQNTGTVQGYFAPSYPAIRDIFYPTFEEAASLMGFSVVIATTNKEVSIYRSGRYYGTVICRSMDNPNSIVGFKIARALVDEIDVLEVKKANNAWNKIIARMRLVIDGVINGIGVTTTPEGFKFVYNTFADRPKESYSMVQASTYENQEYLPPDYIASLYETYPSHLVDAYVKGLFVNLANGSIYRSFSRHTCNCYDEHKKGETVYIGMDFNVDHMAATVYVKRDYGYSAVDEISEEYNTKSVAKLIKERYGDCKIKIYPDSSGKNRTNRTADSGVSESDISMLETEPFNFQCYYNSTNPAVKDRINASNASFEKGIIKINVKKCPNTVKCLEAQVYDDNGQPDKKSGFDHQNDATTYFIAYEFPIVRPAINTNLRFRI